MEFLKRFLVSAPDDPKNKKNQSPFLFYPGDAKNAVQVGLLGFVAFSAYNLFTVFMKRNINPSVDFIDPVESMNCDPIIREAFIIIQNYRKLDPALFKAAVLNVDQLLFLENAMISQQIKPVYNDKILAWTHFRMGVNRLAELQAVIKDTMGNDHALAANMYIKKIYAQMQKHLLNVLHLCSEFNPKRLIERAPMLIAELERKIEQGKAPENRTRAIRKDIRSRSRRSRTSRRSERSEVPLSPLSSAS